MSAEFWSLNPGQIAADEHVSIGCSTREEAEAYMARERVEGRIAYLLVMESEYPIEDDRYRPTLSTRYCIVEKMT